jgi:hypothetical protein
MSDSARKIQATKNYGLFTRHSNENRKFDMAKHRKLLESMKLYGFLKCFPIVCIRDKNGNLIVKDGQHRIAIAQTLGLPVYWVETSEDFDVALVNSAAKPWIVRDYAEKHAANGLRAYSEGLAFADEHHLPVGTAFSLLAGTTSFTNVQEAYISGKFVVKDREWADAVAGIYGPLVALSPAIRNARFIEACMAVCRVPDFDAKRLLDNAKRCRDKLVSYGTRDAFLDMLEQVYNFGRVKMVGLKVAGIMAMRERNATVAAKKNKASANGSAKAKEVALA